MHVQVGVCIHELERTADGCQAECETAWSHCNDEAKVSSVVADNVSRVMATSKVLGSSDWTLGKKKHKTNQNPRQPILSHWEGNKTPNRYPDSGWIPTFGIFQDSARQSHECLVTVRLQCISWSRIFQKSLPTNSLNSAYLWKYFLCVCI